MKYAVFADLHLGSGHENGLARVTISDYRDAGYRIVFAGDTFDIWRAKNALTDHLDILESDDIILVGNHDYGLNHPNVHRSLVIQSHDRRIFVTHGDCVDFWYGFSLLERASRGERTHPLANFLARFRQWETRDVFRYYQAMNLLPEWAVKALEHGRPFAQKLKGVAAAVALCIAHFMEESMEEVTTLPEPSGELLSQAPLELAHRIQGFHSEAKQANAIVMGHLHRPRRSHIGNGRQLIVAGAFVKGVTPTVVTIEEGTVEVHTL